MNAKEMCALSSLMIAYIIKNMKCFKEFGFIPSKSISKLFAHFYSSGHMPLNSSFLVGHLHGDTFLVENLSPNNFAEPFISSKPTLCVRAKLSLQL